jgi:hypothetical protein
VAVGVELALTGGEGDPCANENRSGVVERVRPLMEANHGALATAEQQFLGRVDLERAHLLSLFMEG